MNLQVEKYEDQVRRWPQCGQRILAQFDETSIVVYQAYKPSIGTFAATYGTFGGDFSFSRMSWIKPNFLWMMFRCGWATKGDQETVLAIRILRSGFDAILREAILTRFDPVHHGSRGNYNALLAASNVRMQWDPDHGPKGNPLERRAIQLGLKGKTLRAFAHEWIVSIEDITSFVREQGAHLESGQLGELLTPCEAIYPISDSALRNHIGVEAT